MGLICMLCLAPDNNGVVALGTNWCLRVDFEGGLASLPSQDNGPSSSLKCVGRKHLLQLAPLTVLFDPL